MKKLSYAKDIAVYSFEGATGIAGTISSLLVAPIRIMVRVPQSIAVLPCHLLKQYSEALFLVGCFALSVGLLDLALYKKWVLLVSQIPIILLAVYLRRISSRPNKKAEDKRTVEFDDEQIVELCDSIYPELDAVIGKEE